MLPTLTFIQQTFHRFNQEYFQGTLPTPAFKITWTSEEMGACTRHTRIDAYGITHSRYEISCSKYFDCPLEELENTMLHEMCHLWVFINYPTRPNPRMVPFGNPSPTGSRQPATTNMLLQHRHHAITPSIPRR